MNTEATPEQGNEKGKFSSPLDNLRLISYCPLCNAHYNPREARMLDEKDGAHLIHVNCHTCHSSIVAVVITGGIGVSSVGLVTDLTADDVLRFKEARTIRADEVLDAFAAIQRGSIAVAY